MSDEFHSENFAIATALGELHAGGNGFGIHFHTGRPCHLRDKTLAWIERHGLHQRMLSLKMRPYGDYRYPDKVKQEMLSYHEGDGIVAAFDDHPDTIQMYRDSGVTAYRLSIHSAHPYLIACQKKIRDLFDDR
jgi:hypothetical protein